MVIKSLGPSRQQEFADKIQICEFKKSLSVAKHKETDTHNDQIYHNQEIQHCHNSFSFSAPTHVRKPSKKTDKAILFDVIV